MEIVKKIVASVKSNLIGGVVGGAATYFIAKKYVNVENKWALIGLTVAGGIVGSIIQAKVSAKKSAPTATTLKS